MNIPSLIILILLFISVCLICKNEIINKPLLLIPMLLVGLLVISIIKNDNVEHMTNEAISNCASLFNGGNGKVQNLEVTGKISMNGWEIYKEGHTPHLVIKANNGEWNKDNTGFFVLTNDGNIYLNNTKGKGWVSDNIGGIRNEYFKQGGTELKLGNNWVLNTNDEHLRFNKNNIQQYVMHNNDNTPGFWSKKQEWFADKFVQQGDQVKVCVKSNPGQCLYPESGRTSRAKVNIWDFDGHPSSKFEIKKV
jgi:hypothetical protein